MADKSSPAPESPWLLLAFAAVLFGPAVAMVLWWKIDRPETRPLTPDGDP